jgi:hypothetical protein
MAQNFGSINSAFMLSQREGRPPLSVGAPSAKAANQRKRFKKVAFCRLNTSSILHVQSKATCAGHLQPPNITPSSELKHPQSLFNHVRLVWLPFFLTRAFSQLASYYGLGEGDRNAHDIDSNNFDAEL